MRDEVNRFAQLMSKTMDAKLAERRDRKYPTVEDGNPVDIDEILDSMKEQIDIMRDEDTQRSEVARRCIHVANYAMLLYVESTK